MSEQEVLDGLIGRYRDLNLRVRGLPEERLLLKGSDGESIHHAITRLRDNEIDFSQALKEAISGVPIPEEVVKSHHAVIGTESEEDTTAIILSQFGTARESTLAMLRMLTSEEWERTLGDGASIRTRVQEHMTRNNRSVEQIIGLLGSP